MLKEAQGTICKTGIKLRLLYERQKSYPLYYLSKPSKNTFKKYDMYLKKRKIIMYEKKRSMTCIWKREKIIMYKENAMLILQNKDLFHKFQKIKHSGVEHSI